MDATATEPPHAIAYYLHACQMALGLVQQSLIEQGWTEEMAINLIEDCMLRAKEFLDWEDEN